MIPHFTLSPITYEKTAHCQCYQQHRYPSNVPIRNIMLTWAECAVSHNRHNPESYQVHGRWGIGTPALSAGYSVGCPVHVGGDRSSSQPYPIRRTEGWGGDRILFPPGGKELLGSLCTQPFLFSSFGGFDGKQLC